NRGPHIETTYRRGKGGTRGRTHFSWHSQMTISQNSVIPMKFGLSSTPVDGVAEPRPIRHNRERSSDAPLDAGATGRRAPPGSSRASRSAHPPTIDHLEVAPTGPLDRSSPAGPDPDRPPPRSGPIGCRPARAPPERATTAHERVGPGIGGPLSPGPAAADGRCRPTG